MAELVAQQWAVPVDAKAELEAALRVLAGHFQLHSDAAAGQADGLREPAARPAHARRRARCGCAWWCGLSATFGPLVTPGVGRARLLTLHEGLQPVAPNATLQAEAAHLDAVLEALPCLAEPDHADASWLLDDPEDALAAVEQLPRCRRVAGLDWPRGKPVQRAHRGRRMP